ncbi:MAG: hypothetical protein ACTHJ4_06290 [Candidatus Nucleicultricaceae bacterium]
MQDLSSFQEVVKGNRHRIHLHQKIGLILRLKPTEQQFSLSFYKKRHHQTLKNATEEDLRKLFSSLTCEAESFKFYLYPKSKNNILAIPVPRDPAETVSLKYLIGTEDFKRIPASKIGELSQYFKRELIGTLGHIAYHALPTYMIIESSTQVKNIDFSSKEGFPSLGKPKAEAEVTPKNSDISAFETTASTSSTITTTSTTSAYNEFDFNDADAYIPNYSMSSEEYPSSDNESTDTEYDHPAMPVYAYPVMIVGYDPYDYPIIVGHDPHYVPPYAYPFPPYPTAYNPSFHR